MYTEKRGIIEKRGKEIDDDSPPRTHPAIFFLKVGKRALEMRLNWLMDYERAKPANSVDEKAHTRAFAT